MFENCASAQVKKSCAFSAELGSGSISDSDLHLKSSASPLISCRIPETRSASRPVFDT